MTGYSSHEVVGRNCRFLQGPETSTIVTSNIRCCCEEGTGGVFRLTNYDKSGGKFENILFLNAIRDQSGVAAFVGVQMRIDEETSPNYYIPIEDIIDTNGMEDIESLEWISLG